MSDEQHIHGLEIVINWLDSKAAALEKVMSDTPLGDEFSALIQQSTVINHLYDEAMAEYHAALDVQRAIVENRLATWKAKVAL